MIPNIWLDHLAVSAQSRDAARAHVEEALGLPMQIGGAHPDFGTHNHLMGMEDGLYLEAISIDPQAPAPGRPRWFDLDSFTGAPRLTNWICACSNIGELAQAWPQIGAPMSLTRGDLRWQMAVPGNGKLPWDNLHPAMIEWAGDLHPAAMLSQSGAALNMLTVQHPQAIDLSVHLGSLKHVRFEEGAPGLVAEFDTPHGRRELR